MPAFEKLSNLFIKLMTSLLIAYLLNALYVSARWQAASYYHAQFILVAIIIGLLLNLPKININEKWLYFSGFLLYLAWAIISSTTPFSEFIAFWNNAAQFAQTKNLQILTHFVSPTTIIYYAFFIDIFSQSYFATYIGSAFAWIMAAPLLVKTLINFDVEKRTAVFAAFLYVLSPSTIFFSSVVSSEAVFNLLFMLGLFFTSKINIAKNVFSNAIFASLTFGLLFLTRGTGLFFFAAFFLFVIYKSTTCKYSLSTRLKILTCALLPFLIVLCSEGYLNHKYLGHFSVSGSHRGGGNLLVGTNEQYGGMYNTDDLTLAGFMGPKKVSDIQASSVATHIALQRIEAGPLHFLKFALTQKINSLWNSDAQSSIFWGLYPSPKFTTFKSTGAYETLSRITDAFYLSILIFFILFLIGSLRQKNVNLFLLIVLPLLALALLHIFIEVQPRYHLPFMPFMYIGTAITLSHLRHKKLCKPCN